MLLIGKLDINRKLNSECQSEVNLIRTLDISDERSMNILLILLTS